MPFGLDPNEITDAQYIPYAPQDRSGAQAVLNATRAMQLGYANAAGRTYWDNARTAQMLRGLADPPVLMPAPASEVLHVLDQGPGLGLDGLLACALHTAMSAPVLGAVAGYFLGGGAKGALWGGGLGLLYSKCCACSEPGPMLPAPPMGPPSMVGP